MNDLALVIEDDADLATIFAEAIKTAGFETQVIRDGRTAIIQLGLLMPSIVVLDLHLPKVSGMDILKQIRADARLAKTRVILATADARMADMLQGQADLVLVKPVSFGQLRDLAARLRSDVSRAK